MLPQFITALLEAKIAFYRVYNERMWAVAEVGQSIPEHPEMAETRATYDQLLDWMMDSRTRVDDYFVELTQADRDASIDVLNSRVAEYEDVIDEELGSANFWADEIEGDVDGAVLQFEENQQRIAFHKAVAMRRRAAEEHDQLCAHLVQELAAGRCEPRRLASSWQSTVIKHALAMSEASESAERYKLLAY